MLKINQSEILEFSKHLSGVYAIALAVYCIGKYIIKLHNIPSFYSIIENIVWIILVFIITVFSFSIWNGWVKINDNLDD